MVQIESWEAFVELYQDEITRGALFLRTDQLPDVQSHAIVRLVLPDGVGQLRLDGEVVHVLSGAEAAQVGMSPGFGLQLAPLSRHARATLEQLVERVQSGDFVRAADALTSLGRNKARRTTTSLRITLSDAESRTIQELKSKLAQVEDADDHVILELSPRPTTREIRDAFHRLAGHWHPSASERFGNPEAQHLAMEIFLHLEGAYQRLTLQGARERDEELPTGADAGPGVEPNEPAVSEELETTNPIVVGDRTPAGGLDLEAEGQALERPLSTRRASPFVRRILSQARRAPSRFDTSDASPKVAALKDAASTGSMGGPTHPADHLVSDGMQAMTEKRYLDAVSSFQQAIRARPQNQRRVQVLLHFAEARQLIAERKLDEAQQKYQEVLAIDPENKMAQKDLLMLRCL